MASRTVIAAALWTLTGALASCRREPTVPAGQPPPSSAAEWYAFGNELRREAGDLRGAQDAYMRAIELEPGMAEAHYALGTALLDLRLPEDAAAALESALSLAPAGAPWRKDAEDALARANVLR